MSRLHQPPAALRYFKARLRPLARPQFWLALTVLSLVGVFAAAYFTNPEQFAFGENNQNAAPATGNGNQTVDTTLTPEEKAIAADIDNSAVLEQDLLTIPSLQLTPETQKEQGLFDEFMKQRQANDGTGSSGSQQTQKSLAEQSLSNPFSIKPQDTPSVVNPVVPNLFNPGASAPNPANSTTQNPGSATVNPLQSALDRQAGNNSTLVNPNGTPINPLQSALDRNPTGNSTIASPQTGTPTTQLPQNPNGLRQQDGLANQLGTQFYPGATGQPTTPTSPYYSPNGYTPLPGQVNSPVSPVPNGTGYNLPPGYTSNSINSYTYLNQPQNATGVPVAPGNAGQYLPNTVPGSGLYNPGYNSNVANPGLQQPSAAQVQTQPPPFSVPNSIPGRNIGGGRINTFSNP